MTAPALAFSTPFGRFYAHPAKASQVPSITNVINLKHKPLKGWAARLCAEYTADNLGKLAALDRREVIELVRTAPDAGQGEASGIGDMVHNWIDRHVKGDGPTDAEFSVASHTARNMWRSFLAFDRHYHPEYRDTEFTVWSDKHLYAGTGDLSMRLGETLLLVDTKTGNRVYPEVAMQLAALARADYILGTDGSERELPKWERFAVLHLRPTFARLIPVERIDEAFSAFIGLRQLFDFTTREGEVLGYAPKIEAA